MTRTQEAQAQMLGFFLASISLRGAPIGVTHHGYEHPESAC